MPVLGEARITLAVLQYRATGFGECALSGLLSAAGDTNFVQLFRDLSL